MSFITRLGNIITRNSTLSRQLRLFILTRVVDSATTMFLLLTGGREIAAVSNFLITHLGPGVALALITVASVGLVLFLHFYACPVASDFLHKAFVITNCIYLIVLIPNFLGIVLRAACLRWLI